MRYLGSKTLLLDDIANIVQDYTKEGTFCDPFGGIGTVGKFMKEKGYQVITGDILYFAHCFQISLIENNEDVALDGLKNKFFGTNDIDVEQYLNSLAFKDGWLVEEYARKRKFFTEENAMKIQACIDCIYQWKENDMLNGNEYEILIASLIQSFDKVANTAGTYYAYLKKIYRKAKNIFYYELLKPIKSEKKCKAYLEDANQLVKKHECDVLYLDPPYNERNYERYYHLPENVANATIPVPYGKSGVYATGNGSSLYNKKLQATIAFDNLIDNSRAGCIIFHYTDIGLININDARDILRKKGNVQEFYFDCKGYSTVSNAEKCKHHILKVII